MCMHELRKSIKPQSTGHCIANGHNYHPPNSTIHRLTQSHLKGLVEVVARQHTGFLEHLLTAASQLSLDTDAATLLPSAGQDEVAASAAALQQEDQTVPYSSQATHVTSSPHDQSTTTQIN